MNLPTKLRILRAAKNMNQLEVAEKVGVTRVTYVRWENGQVMPKLPNIIDLAKVFEVPTEVLENDSISTINLSNDFSISVVGDNNQINQSSDNEVINLFNSLDIFQKAKVITFIAELKKNA